jgi:hypothetical protein
MMLRDFRIGWRLLLRHPLNTAVELLGLAAGFAVCFVLLAFVQYSFSYDRDVPQREQVYVIKHRLNFIPQPQWMEYTPFAHAWRGFAKRPAAASERMVAQPGGAEPGRRGAHGRYHGGGSGV